MFWQGAGSSLVSIFSVCKASILYKNGSHVACLSGQWEQGMLQGHSKVCSQLVTVCLDTEQEAQQRGPLRQTQQGGWAADSQAKRPTMGLAGCRALSQS